MHLENHNPLFDYCIAPTNINISAHTDIPTFANISRYVSRIYLNEYQMHNRTLQLGRAYTM